MKALLVVLLVALFALAGAKDACEVCRNNCSLIKRENLKQICDTACNYICPSGDDFEEEEDVSEDDEEEADALAFLRDLAKLYKEEKKSRKQNNRQSPKSKKHLRKPAVSAAVEAFDDEEMQDNWPQQKCVNADVLNIRNDNGDQVGELKSGAKVTVTATKAMRGETFAKIGNGQFVALRFLKNCAAPAPAPTPAPSSSGNKAQEALKEIFKSEGKCQNWENDSGNHFQGKKGYTCMGIIPSVAWEHRNDAFAKLFSGYSGHPADFVKYAYDKDKVEFEKASAQVYTNSYFGPGGCNPLPQPAFYICADIAVNSGVGRSKQYLNEFGGFQGGDVKAFARKLNERHRQDYKKWGAPGTKNNVFLQGWLNRAAERDRYIDNYKL